jgi:hypothetical protein
VSITNPEFFINFVGNLKLLSYFEVIVRKIHINYEIFSKIPTFEPKVKFKMKKITVDENHACLNLEKNHYTMVIPTKLVTSIKHSIFRVFQNSKWMTRLGKLHFC